MKVTFLGGGSLRLLPIIRGIFSNAPAFFVNGEICLIDRELSRAEAVGKLILACPEYRNINCNVVWSDDLDSSLPGTDVMYLTMGARRQPTHSQAMFLANKYGYIYTDNLSINGAFLSLRLGRTILNIARKMEQYCPLCCVLCFGMAYGGAVVLGKTMGSGDLALAERNAKRLIFTTLASGLLGSVLIICLKPILPFIAELSESAAHYRDLLVYINSFSIFGAAVNTVLICGIFSAGGDSKFGFIIDLISMWFVSVPLGLIAAFVLKLPPIWVYFILYLDEFEKMPIVIIHYLRKKWLRNITREM